MSYKQMPRLGSAIASTILSLFWAMSLVGVDKAQAATLTYNFDAEGAASGSFKFNNSSLTGIGEEQIAVSEGRLNTYLTASFNNSPLKGKDYYNLAGATALFYQGGFRGLQARGSDNEIVEINVSADEPKGILPFYTKFDGRAQWEITTYPLSLFTGYPLSFFTGYKELLISDRDRVLIIDKSGFGRLYYPAQVSYTLVNTEPEPVPEPLTAGGTALALAGLSWLKHKKKMAA